MSTDFDVKKYLVDDMGFDEATATEMAAKFKPENVAKVTQSRSALAAEQQRLQKAQEDFTAANDRFNAELAEWSQLSKAEQAAATELRTRLEAAETQAFTLQQRLTRVATDAGIDPKTVLPTEPIAEPKEKAVPDFDASKYVQRDQIAPALDFSLELPGTLQYIADQHRDLFGKSLDTREIVREIKSRAGNKQGLPIDPVAIWEEKFKVPERRSALAEETRQTELKAAEERGYNRRAEELASPGPSTPGRRAPVFLSRDAQNPRVSALKRPVPESGVRAAAAAFASGKYRVATK